MGIRRRGPRRALPGDGGFLEIVEFLEQPSLAAEFVIRAGLYDAAVVEDQNPVRGSGLASRWVMTKAVM